MSIKRGPPIDTAAYREILGDCLREASSAPTTESLDDNCDSSLDFAEMPEEAHHLSPVQRGWIFALGTAVVISGAVTVGLRHVGDAPMTSAEAEFRLRAAFGGEEVQNQQIIDRFLAVESRLQQPEELLELEQALADADQTEPETFDLDAVRIDNGAFLYVE
ncbi:MAG: hypothetical protein KDD69_00590 [Bdellovibrionales bacterium]|nr:hypothetical protein [Bdellovibrionales bacterium]